MHDGFLAVLMFAAGDSGGDSSTGTTAVYVALIGGLALVATVLIPALLNRREKEPRQIRDLRKDRDEWHKLAVSREETITATVKGMTLRDEEIDRQNAEIDRLRALCVDHGINPFIPKAAPSE